jgi:hypothetical protein
MGEYIKWSQKREGRDRKEGNGILSTQTYVFFFTMKFFAIKYLFNDDLLHIRHLERKRGLVAVEHRLPRPHYTQVMQIGKTGI